MARNRLTLGVAIVAVVAAALAWRTYSRWPTRIKGTGPVSTVELRSDSVKVTLDEGTTLSQVADLTIFERFAFDSSGPDAETLLGRADKWENEGDASFHEYIRPTGRLRFYRTQEYGADGRIKGLTNWVEALPNELFADQFLDRSIARHLDLSRPTQRVYIPVPAQRCYITATLDGPRVTRIAWLPYSP